jgi:transitional endoplasmic reticulum ATPase
MTDAQRAVLIAEFQTLIKQRSSQNARDDEQEHKHTCATCGSVFVHDCEEECPEIHGSFYCPGCHETAEKHEHYCPICSERWTHYSVPNCDLDELAQCSRHTATPHPGARGLAAVAGMASLKDLMYEQVIAPLRKPERLATYRLSVPNGILMYGPPGCGKTLIARKLSEELGYFFKEISAGNVGDSFVHGTATKINSIFSEAEKNAPAVLFIDEFESFVPDRSALSSHQDYRLEEIGEFLRHLDNAGQRRILVIAASNEPWRIDPAIQRSGRLDKKILVSAPDLPARADMLRFHLEERLRAADLDLYALAGSLKGYSASDLKLLVEEAAWSACRKSLPISMTDLTSARKLVPPSISDAVSRKYEEYGQ